jgi:hypothetical protein
MASRERRLGPRRITLGPLGVAVALAHASLGSGCVTIAHEAGIFDWYASTTRTKGETRNVAVTSSPQSLSVSRTDPNGSVAQIGVTPLVDAVPFEIEEKVETPKTGALWIGTALEIAGGFAMMVAGVAQTGHGIDVGRFFLFGMTGSFIATSGMIDGIAALIHGGKGERVTRSDRTLEYLYAARVDGGEEARATVRLPGQTSAHLALASKGGSPEIQSANAAWIVAVMNVEDSMVAKSAETDPMLLANLSDQIRVFVAQRGIRTIDRSAQETALKSRIDKLKRDSYQACYDNSCQIELGKALAASHILRTRITHFGRRCVLNGELIDLKTEVTVGAASSQGACEAEGFLQMGEAVAKDLIRAR